MYLKRTSSFYPYHTSALGEAFLCDTLEFLPDLHDASVDLILTSPPFALKRKKEYGISRDNGGAIPPNLLELANTDSNGRYQQLCREYGVKVHPARFPPQFAEFFIKFLTAEGALVFDPFAGSNTTGFVAEKLARRWLATELSEEYLRGSKFRFSDDALPVKTVKRVARAMPALSPQLR